MEAEVGLAARKDSVTSQESSDWGEQLKDFQPGHQENSSEQNGLKEKASEKKYSVLLTLLGDKLDR